MRIADNKEGLTLLMKLGSLAVHADEYLFSGQSAPEDVIAIRGLLDEPEVRDCLAQLAALSLLPVRRDGVSYPPVIVDLEAERG